MAWRFRLQWSTESPKVLLIESRGGFSLGLLIPWLTKMSNSLRGLIYLAQIQWMDRN